MRALAPHWGALLALGLFLVAGLAVLDDYGITPDEALHRNVALAKILHLQGEPYTFPLDQEFQNFYGAAFQVPLALAERAFDLRDARGIHLFRHLITHLFFLTGGLFTYLLTRRLSVDSLVGLFGMLIFLLHPRLYAHSFYNGQDIPFLVMFAVALYLTHRAFKRDSLFAFALLGVGAGMLANLRITGLVLLAAVPALRALDFSFAEGWAERKRILLSTGGFAIACALTFYMLLPHLWADPVERIAEWWTTLSGVPPHIVVLFRGTVYPNTYPPWEYIPVWFSITSPPFALLLGCVAIAAIFAGAARSPRGVLRNTRLRFGLLLACCFAAPIAAVMYSDVAHYHDWRHMYFLWAPFSLLVAFGLRRLALALRSARRRAAVYGAAGAGLAAALASMALIHPNQQASFNFSVDRVTPEFLQSRYVMAYWPHPMRQALEWLSDNADLLPNRADSVLRVADMFTLENLAFLPDEARSRIAGNLRLELINQAAPGARTTDAITLEEFAFLPDAARARIIGNLGFEFYLAATRESWARSAVAIHRTRVYNNTILTLERKDDLQAVYDATREREPVAVAAFDVHQLDGSVALVMEPCAPAFIERVGATLRVTPVDLGDLPPWREGKRQEPRRFGFAEYGAFFDGKCVASLPLPGYPIADFRLVWHPNLMTDGEGQEAMRRAQEEGRLLTRAEYDIRLVANELVYVQEECDPLGTEHPFQVSVFPDHAADSPEGRGGELLYFDFLRHGALLEDGTCVALFPLPDYPVAGIRTAQYVEGSGDLWAAAFSANPERHQAAYRAVEGSAPVARGAFDLHSLDGDLVYVKEPCEQADTEARFFLHIVPERLGDLPEARRELGFDNLDFWFFLNGAWFDGQCAARVKLPSYPIASVRTGQFVGGAGEIWSAEFAVQ